MITTAPSVPIEKLIDLRVACVSSDGRLLSSLGVQYYSHELDENYIANNI
jgi:hypothetical protein